MARQRFIWPDLWEDPEIGRLEPVVQLFFIGCFSNADDEGRLLANPAFLRATIFPYLDFTIDEVTEIRDAAVAGCTHLLLYEVENVAYLAFEKWSSYQKPKYPKPSKLPPPPSKKTRKQQGKASGNVSEEPEETLEEDSVKDSTVGWVGLGRVENPPAPLSKGGTVTLTKRELRRYTGCRAVRGSHGQSWVRDPLGTDKPPASWSHEPPSREEVQAALAERNGNGAPEPDFEGPEP